MAMVYGPVIPKEILKERKAEAKRALKDVEREMKRKRRGLIGPVLPPEIMKARKAAAKQALKDVEREVARAKKMRFAGTYGKAFAGGVQDPLYKRALKAALAVLPGSKRRKKVSKKKSKARIKKPSAAQQRARKAFAARARSRSAEGLRAGSRYNPRTATAAQKKLYQAALRDARKVGVRRPKKKVAKKPLSAEAQYALALAKGGGKKAKKIAAAIPMQNWLCRGVRRTGCGGAGKVVSGKGRFARLR